MKQHQQDKAQTGFQKNCKPFLEHLEDLRFVLIKTAVIFLGFACVCFFCAGPVISILSRPLHAALASSHPDPSASLRMTSLDPATVLRSLSPTGAFITSIKVSLLAALVLSLPFIVVFTMKFILPACTSKEKNVFLPLAVTATLLFLIGMFFCFQLVLPSVLRFLWNYTETLGIRNDWTINNYISLCLKLMLGFGLAFEVPPLIIACVKLELLDYYQLKYARKYAIVGAFVFSAVLTPPDIFTQMAMALPLIGLFELSVWVSYFMMKHEIRRSVFGDRG